MGATIIVTLIVSIFNSSTGVESVRTERMSRAACEFELLLAAKSRQSSEFIIAQCVSDSKFFGGK